MAYAWKARSCLDEIDIRTIKMHQPYTTETTARGLLIARNSMRLKLWADDVFAHRWLCHPSRECKDGCDVKADSARLKLYESELE